MTQTSLNKYIRSILLQYAISIVIAAVLALLFAAFGDYWKYYMSYFECAYSDVVTLFAFFTRGSFLKKFFIVHDFPYLHVVYRALLTPIIAVLAVLCSVKVAVWVEVTVSFLSILSFIFMWLQ